MKAILTGLAAAFVFSLLPMPSANASTNVTAWISTYDYWNNSPPGYGISYPGLHGWACCRNGGTYANPITFASQPNELKPGTRIYIPYFKRYFIKEDDCATCYSDRWQFDLWVGGVSYAQEHNQASTNIVNMWAQEKVIINPPKNEPVSTSLFAGFKI